MITVLIFHFSIEWIYKKTGITRLALVYYRFNTILPSALMLSYK